MNRSQSLLLGLGLLLVAGAATCTYQTHQPSPRARHESHHTDCTFCKINSGESSGTILYEDNDVMVIEKQRAPQAGLAVDCLIVPKKHLRNLKAFDQNNSYDQIILSKMGFVAQKLGTCLTGDGGFRNEINNEFGQGVFHLHMHFKSPHAWARKP